MPNTLVIAGAHWGDEGKGKVVHALAARAHVVVRTQGGSNAGHTVVVGGREVKLHLVPSGILYPGVLNVLGNGMVIDPGALVAEMRELQEAGLFRGELRISARAHLVLPYHQALDRLEEEARGTTRIGTTGRGIGPAYADKVARCGIRMADLLEPARLAARLAEVLPLKNRLLQQVYGAPGFEKDQLVEELVPLGRILAPLVTGEDLLTPAARAGRRILFEGAQGTLLDVDHGTYPFVTASAASAAGAALGAGVGPTFIRSVWLVAKAYTTRVGAGPFPTEIEGEPGPSIRERGREYGTTTGRPRRIGWFDGILTRYSARINGATGLALTRLDVLDGLDRVRVAVAYRLRGRILEDVPVTAEDWAACEPVYEELPGWEGAAAARRWEELPAPARRYVERLEALVGAPAALVSVGATPEATIWRMDPWENGEAP